MGKYNSSICRVRPLMEIVENDYLAFEKLISLVNISGLSKPLYYAYDGLDETKKEKQLKPTKAHLIKLIDYMSTKDFGDATIANFKRSRLFFGDEREEARQEAQAQLEASYNLPTFSCRAWYVFEGFTSPDIFIEGDDYIIVCEGKWTEPHITETTTHLEKRNQMIRHIQGALNYSDKKVFAFYIVDRECGYLADLEPNAFAEQIFQETIKIDETERARILSAYVGYTTWQDIEEKIPRIRFKSKDEI